MSDNPVHLQPRRLFSLGFLGWLTVLAIDFFLHAGLLASLYDQATPFFCHQRRLFD
jgi:hypothetical protein